MRKKEISTPNGKMEVLFVLGDLLAHVVTCEAYRNTIIRANREISNYIFYEYHISCYCQNGASLSKLVVGKFVD